MTHTTETKYNGLRDWQALCSCGWTGPTRAKAVDAVEDELNHMQAFACNPDESGGVA